MRRGNSVHGRPIGLRRLLNLVVWQEGQLERADLDDEPEVLCRIRCIGKGVGLLFPKRWIDREGDAFEATGIGA